MLPAWDTRLSGQRTDPNEWGESHSYKEALAWSRITGSLKETSGYNLEKWRIAKKSGKSCQWYWAGSDTRLLFSQQSGCAVSVRTLQHMHDNELKPGTKPGIRISRFTNPNSTTHTTPPMCQGCAVLPYCQAPKTCIFHGFDVSICHTNLFNAFCQPF